MNNKNLSKVEKFSNNYKKFYKCINSYFGNKHYKVIADDQKQVIRIFNHNGMIQELDLEIVENSTFYEVKSMIILDVPVSIQVFLKLTFLPSDIIIESLSSQILIERNNLILSMKREINITKRDWKIKLISDLSEIELKSSKIAELTYSRVRTLSNLTLN